MLFIDVPKSSIADCNLVYSDVTSCRLCIEKKEEVKEKVEKPKKVKPPPPPPVHKKDFEQDVVYVYQFCRSPNVPTVSPYCLKLETWIKLNGIKYEVST